MICVDQSREGLTGEKSVFEELSGGFDTLALGAQEVNSRAYCSWFGFTGQAQQKKLSKLSGGERNRVQLAKVLKSGGNVLLLDEPTNDLDVNTMRSLEEVRGSTAMRQLCRAPQARSLTADPDHWP